VEYDTNALRTFLIQRFKWGWLDKAAISKTYDGNGIKISHGLNSILIILNLEKTKAILRFRGEIIYEFIVRDITPNNQSENILIIYTDEFRVFPDKGFLKIPLVQMHLDTFKRFLQSRVMELIFSLSLVYRARLSAIDILVP
jgi:hypothetical protein